MREALEFEMRRNPAYWRSYYRSNDDDELRLSRAFSFSDRCRYYWPQSSIWTPMEDVAACKLSFRARFAGGIVCRQVPSANGSLSSFDSYSRLEIAISWNARSGRSEQSPSHATMKMVIM